MSQRTKNIEETIEINIPLTVTLNGFSNHNGFSDTQVENAIKEFKENIQKELTDKLTDSYQMEEFLHSVDFVNYEVNNK